METLLADVLPKADKRTARGVRIGTLVATDGVAPIIDYDDNPHGPLEAKSIVAINPADRDREVLMMFERGNAKRPIIIGFLLDRPLSEPVPDEPAASDHMGMPMTARIEGRHVREVKVDGDRLVFDAKKEIMLRCGEGSILMRADGKVIIKGINITTRARVLNKVKGAAVKIN